MHGGSRICTSLVATPEPDYFRGSEVTESEMSCAVPTLSVLEQVSKQAITLPSTL